MQDMRYDEDFGSSDFCSCKGPEIISDIRNGYRKSLQAEYYKATMELQEVGSLEKVYFVLANPKASGVNVYINRVLSMNFSQVPLGAIRYIGSKIGGNIEISEWIRSTNTYQDKKESMINVYFGKNLFLKELRAESRVSVPPFKTDVSEFNGEILLAPGNCYVTEVAALVLNEDFTTAVSAEWWEEPDI